MLHSLLLFYVAVGPSLAAVKVIHVGKLCFDFVGRRFLLGHVELKVATVEVGPGVLGTNVRKGHIVTRFATCLDLILILFIIKYRLFKLPFDICSLMNII